MTVLSFYNGYLPGEKYGGPVSSLYNFAELLGDDISLHIVCSNHDLNETAPYPGISDGWNEVGKAKVKYIADADMNAFVCRQIIGEVKPDVIYISSIFSAKFNAPIYKATKKTGIPVLLAPRGELNGGALSGGKLKKSVYLLYFRLFLMSESMHFQATSPEEYQDIQKALKVSESRLCLLPNVPSLPCRKETIEKQPDCLKMCFVGRIVPNKNLTVCLEALKKVTFDTVFDIYGPQENAQYWDECEKIINSLPSNVKVNARGVLGQLEMRKRYKDYDCLISPTRFENYGQAIVEAMLHDTPVIISKSTTPWDDVGKSDAGFVISLDNIDGFAEAIDTIGRMDADCYNNLVSRLRKYVQATFNFEELKQKYINEFKKISE